VPGVVLDVHVEFLEDGQLHLAGDAGVRAIISKHAARNRQSSEKGIELIQCGALRIQVALGMNWSGRMKGAAEFWVELLDDEGEATGDLENGVAEGPVLLRQDLVAASG
jgi:hypothetical protein